MPSSSSVPSPLSCEYSVPTWKRVPQTWEVFFAVQLPYCPPRSSFGAYAWRKRLWLESTFALTMMQPWEKIVLMVTLTLLSVLFTTAVTFYLPLHLAVIFSRAKYYLSGEVSSAASSATSTADSTGGSHSYVLDVLSGYGEYAYAGVTGGMQRLIDTWRTMANGTGLNAEL